MEHLKTEEDMALYLQACLDDSPDDASLIVAVLGDIAKARGMSMSQIARDAGLGDESLHKALSGEDGPSFWTVLKVIRALGFRLAVRPVAHA